MTNKKIAVIDLDMFKHGVASVGEDRSVLVKHKETGWSKSFKTRTEFYGHHKKKAGGWLADVNEGREPEKIALPEHFTYEDVQVAQPIENVLHSAKMMVERAIEASGATGYKAFIGKGESFRVQKSTLLKYKGNRDNTIKALLLDEVSEYLTKKFKAEVVTHIENDDKCVMEAYKKPDHFILCEDKDFWGCPVNVFNVNSPERGIVNCDKFGSLWRDSKGKVRGEGRLHLMWQVCGQDDSDHYKAHAFSDVYWGEVTAYEALKDCTNDKESWIKAAEIFKTLYPEPKVVTGWKGDEFEIDWKYVLNEQLQMARMLRFDGDEVSAYDVLDKMGIV